MKVSPFIIKWYHSFLTGGSQLVRVNEPISSLWPQTRVAPRDASVFHYFTHSTQTTTHATSGNFIAKFADDSAFMSLLFTHRGIDTYFSEVNRYTEQCTDNILELNTNQTKETIFDPKSICALAGGYQWSKHWTSCCACNHTDSKLSCSVNVETRCSWAQNRLYFFRLLLAFGSSTNIVYVMFVVIKKNFFFLAIIVICLK